MGITSYPVAKTKPYVTDPAEILTRQAAYGSAYLKFASASTATDAGAAFFTTHIDKCGAASLVATNDTYATLCDLTGSGFICNIISPTDDATFTCTIKFTIDGTVYELAYADLTALYRLIWGPSFFAQPSTSADAATTGNIYFPGSHDDLGFSAASVASDSTYNTAGDCYIITPYQLFSFKNYYGLYFEDACKVEIKLSVVSTTSEHERCGITYRMNP